MNAETKTWTDEAESYLQGYLQQVEALLTHEEADPKEVVSDLRSHICQMAETQAGALVTVPDLKRMLGTVGTPEDVAASWVALAREPADEDPWAAPYLNPPEEEPASGIPRYWVGIGAAIAACVVLFAIPIWTYFSANEADVDPSDSGSQIPAVTPASATVTSPNRVFDDWTIGGTAQEQYDFGTERRLPGFTGDTMYLRSKTALSGGFVTAMRTMPAENYRGYSVTVRAIIAPENVTGWAGLWLRIDGTDHQMLQFDNMQDRPITGTRAPEAYQVTLEVPPNALELAYGVLLEGNGMVRFDKPGLSLARAENVLAGSTGMYTEQFILEHPPSYFFARMVEPDEGYHKFAGLWAIQLKASWAESADRDQIIARALEIAQDPQYPFVQRFQCCYAVSIFEDPRIIPHLEYILRSDSTSLLREVAATSLGYFEAEEANEALKRAAANEPDAKVQWIIQRALAGEFPRPRLPKPGTGPKG